MHLRLIFLTKLVEEEDGRDMDIYRVNFRGRNLNKL